MGVEIAALQTGLDIRARNGMSLGPYLGFLPGMFLDVDATCTGRGCATTNPAVSLDDKAFHLWALFGIRGALLVL